MKEEKKTIRIANTTIVLGQKYTLDHKRDGSAPNGMQKIGASKFPFEGNDTVEKVWFNDARRQYDTGFYPESPCLSVIPQEQRATLVKTYEEHIKNKYEKAFNVSLDPSEKNDFWENFTITAYVNKQFDTSKLDDLLELFYILYMGVACEKDEKNPFLNEDAQFIITSPVKMKNKSKDLTKMKLSVTTNFMTIMEADRAKLDLILQWIGKEDPKQIKDEDLGLIYYEIINNSKEGANFCEKFKSAVEEYETEKGKEKMEWFYSIKKLHNLRKIKKSNRGYVVAENDKFLGNTLQDVASFCLNENSEQRQIITELIEENPSVKKVEISHIKQV